MTSLIRALTICWGTTMISLAALLIYRSLVAMKEEDQLFLDPAEWQLAREQEAILSRLRRITPYVKGLTILSVALLSAIIAVLLYRTTLSLDLF